MFGDGACCGADIRTPASINISSILRLMKSLEEGSNSSKVVKHDLFKAIAILISGCKSKYLMICKSNKSYRKPNY
jgi:hypothetical protein